MHGESAGEDAVQVIPGHREGHCKPGRIRGLLSPPRPCPAGACGVEKDLPSRSILDKAVVATPGPAVRPVRRSPGRCRDVLWCVAGASGRTHAPLWPAGLYCPVVRSHLSAGGPVGRYGRPRRIQRLPADPGPSRDGSDCSSRAPGTASRGIPRHADWRTTAASGGRCRARTRPPAWMPRPTSTRFAPTPARIWAGSSA